MDRSQHITSALDELRQIQHELRRARKLDDLRFYFERVQALRRAHPDDFDLQLKVAEVQDELLGRGRLLRGPDSEVSAAEEESEPIREPEKISASLAGGPQQLDPKTWQRATYLALFFTVILFFAFFYLVQTARRLNFPQPSTADAKPAPAGKSTNEEDAKRAAVDGQAAPGEPKPVALSGPLLRIYTDLIPATLVLDDKPPQDILDGEFTLDKLEPGRHSLRISGRSGTAALSFDVNGSAAPRVLGQPVASNVMAVAVSTEDGRGQLITNADHPAVLLDGSSVGQADTDGVALESLGHNDHDLQVTESKDRQRFVLTYAAVPALTIYVKADPNAGTVIVTTALDEADVFINDKLYRRRTDHGQVRIPLKVGDYTIRVHKAGYIDPAPQTVQVKKAEEVSLDFKLEPSPQLATLQVKNAVPGTVVYLDREVAAMIGAEGEANITNVKPGPHAIELRRDQAVSKKFDRTFATGETVVLSGPETTLDKAVPDNKPTATAIAPTPTSPPAAAAPSAMAIDGQQVRKGGGFVAYNVPHSAGHYSFQAQARKGGLFKRGKVQWYAGYQDAENYVLYSLDGKHATVREVRNGQTTELGKLPLEFDGDQWVQVDMSVKPNALVTRVKTQAGGWEDLPAVSVTGRDLTQGKVGVYIPGSEELAVANFHFSNRQ